MPQGIEEQYAATAAATVGIDGSSGWKSYLLTKHCKFT